MARVQIPARAFCRDQDCQRQRSQASTADESQRNRAPDRQVGSEQQKYRHSALISAVTADVAGPDRKRSIADRFPRAWTLWAATRPSQFLLVGLVYVLGVGMATAGPPVTRGVPPASTLPGALSAEVVDPVLVGAIALVPVTVAIHYANEYADVETDRLTTQTPFSGGSGALERTGLAPTFLRSATIAATLIAAIGIVGVSAMGRLPVDAVALLVVIFGLGLAYSLPPIAFVRRGVGEVVNAVLGGLLLPLYGVAVVASPTVLAALAVLPFALVVGCNLCATHWPDREADEQVGKRTLAVRWSSRRLRLAYGVLTTAAIGGAVGLWVGGVVPDAVALAHVVPLPFLLWGGVVLTRQRSPLPAVLAMVILAIGATIGWWWVGIVA